MRKSTLAAGGIALVLTLSACGGDDNSANNAFSPEGGGELFSSVEQLVASASEKTEQSKSSKFSMEMAMMGQKVTAQGQALYAGADTKMAMTMDMQGMSMEMRLVDGAVYIKMPPELSGQTGGKPWMKVSSDGDGPLAQSMSNFDQMAEQSDPTKMLEQLKQAGGKIKNSESTTLDGQQVTHYTVEFDPAKAAGMLGGGGELTEQQKQQMSQLGMIPMEIYLNSEGLPVQIEMDMAAMMKSAGAPGGGEAKMVMKYTDWGTPVTVEAPPADQVGEMPSN